MKRIVKVLVVTALLVVLMASTAVSPAFAEHTGEYHFGYGPKPDYKYSGKDENPDDNKDPHVYGWACGSKNNDGYNDVCEKR